MADKKVITTLEAQVRQLIAAHRDVSAACRELTAEREKLKAENRTLKERIRALEADVARLELCEGLGGSDSNREKARARVNRLMREVDRCIALLNKQPLADDGADV